MEVIYHDWVGQEMVPVEDLQLKAEHKVAMPEGAKKVVSVTCHVYPQNTEIKDNDIIITGNTAIRLIYLNEFDKYDSAEVVQPWENKIASPNLANLQAITSTVNMLDSKWTLADNTVQLNNVLQVNITAVSSKNCRLVTDLTGDVEVKPAEHQVLSFNTALQEKFTLEENITLDKNCEGVLGVDADAVIKDVTCTDGKVVVKGVIAANIIGVKTLEETSLPYNTTAEIEFAKSIVVAGVSNEDLANGTVQVTAMQMRIENNNKESILALQIDLQFCGYAYVYQKLNTVVDAISFTKELTFATAALEHTEMLPQINTTVDIENNMNMPANTPYIARVLAIDGVQVHNLNVAAADGKALIEGVLTANVLVENEDHLLTNYLAEAPFQTSVRTDGADSNYRLQATATPVMINVKARRGVELLIDAKLAISLCVTQVKTIPVMTEVQIGPDKVDDGSAIRIYIIGDKENLWDLAKRTNISSEELIKQNPNLENGCLPGERIVVYRHETVNL